MNVKLIKAWIENNDPQGMAKLSATAEISIGTVVKILKDGHQPGLEIARKLAKVIGVSLDELCGSESDAS